LATLDTDVPDVQAKSVELLHTAGVPHHWVLRPGVAQKLAQVGAHPPVASVQVRVWLHPEHADHTVTFAGVPQDWVLRPGTAQREAQVIGSPPVCSVQVRVWFHPVQVSHRVTLAGTGHAAFGLLQVRSSVPPPVERQDQVDDPPQEPARLPELVPLKHANWIELSHQPLIQAAFAFVQAVGEVGVHPSILSHHQVEDSPQLFVTGAITVPEVQANWIALLHTAGVPQD
jgi:hypothetical protein